MIKVTAHLFCEPRDTADGEPRDFTGATAAELDALVGRRIQDVLADVTKHGEEFVIRVNRVEFVDAEHS